MWLYEHEIFVVTKSTRAEKSTDSAIKCYNIILDGYCQNIGLLAVLETFDMFTLLLKQATKNRKNTICPAKINICIG